MERVDGLAGVFQRQGQTGAGPRILPLSRAELALKGCDAASAGSALRRFFSSIGSFSGKPDKESSCGFPTTKACSLIGEKS